MLSNVLDRISFWSLFVTIVLLPVFLLPFSRVPIETSKGLLLVVGLIVSLVFWMAARLSDGKISLPKSLVLLSGLGIVIAFLISAIFSSSPPVSFFGTMFDVGTFWFVFSCFLVMFTTALVLGNTKSLKLLVLGIVASFAAVMIFQSFRIFFPGFLTLGALSTKLKTDNILGSWNAFGIFVGLGNLISLFMIEFFPISKAFKWVLGALILLGTALIAVVGSTFIWGLMGAFAIFIFIYKISFFSGLNKRMLGRTNFPFSSLAFIMVSLLFLISGQFITNPLQRSLKMVSTEIVPTFGATMSVSKAVLAEHPILGLGPNRFGEAWAMYKPASVNTSQFWNIFFESGFGLLPTFISTIGLLGVFFWLMFLITLVLAGIKSVFSNQSENQANLDLAMIFIAAMYLFASAFFYFIGSVLFLLAFVFTGLFIGLSSNRSGGRLNFSIFQTPKRSFFSIFIIVLIMIASAAFGFKYVERFASVPYFDRAVAAQNLPATPENIAVAESYIKKALSLYSNDFYFNNYAKIYLIKLTSSLNKSSLSDAEKADLQVSLDQAINGATMASNYDKENYSNFQTLGYVYSTAGSLGVSGAYAKAAEAYTTASRLNPLNPELKVLVAQAYLGDGKTKEATDATNQALVLKPDYANAYVMLSQIAKHKGDNALALSYANKALTLSPQDPDLINYANSLKR